MDADRTDAPADSHAGNRAQSRAGLNIPRASLSESLTAQSKATFLLFRESLPKDVEHVEHVEHD